MWNKLKIYSINDVIYKLKICKQVSDNWLLCYTNISTFITYDEWNKIIAFINCARFDKKQKFYDSKNNWNFII